MLPAPLAWVPWGIDQLKEEWARLALCPNFQEDVIEWLRLVFASCNERG